MINYLKKRPGLILLLVILSIITAVSIKPDFYLVGWDNYSSYFNLKTNIFRTFFATWREYRGLGVASDAESTDVFRQIWYWIMHFIIPQQLLDQIYYLFTLWVGVIGMYTLGKKLAKTSHEFFGFIAAIFYLFNLNTLSIFYSPIIPFTNRFYSLPITLIAFLNYLNNRRKKDLIVLSLLLIVTSGSYVTPTILITSLLAFAVFFYFQTNLKKTVILTLFFLVMNAFWIFPFLNYTAQKADIVPLARTFIEINESTLNKAASNFSLLKQAVLYPSFFDISFTSPDGKKIPIHPLLSDYNKTPGSLLLLVFPGLYILGSITMLLDWKKNKKILWAPAWIIVFLFLSTKEFSPMGFVYSLTKKIIPFFDVIFRISDTKFHTYISLAGAIASAYVICELINWLSNKKAFKFFVIFSSFVCIFYLSLFRSYFNGNLIGFFVYTKIPQAYFDLAEKINNEPGDGRVIHLPMDNWHHYWRSFSWGYLGSAFFNFMIDKPYVDKTFEPASMENTYLHSKMNHLIDQFYQESDLNKARVADNFLSLLKQTGIQFIIVDHSISSDIYARDIAYSTKQSVIKAASVIKYLNLKNQVKLAAHYSIPLNELYVSYKKLYPANIVEKYKSLPTETNIDLYEITDSNPTISFLSQTVNIDPGLNNLLETEIESMNSTQKEGSPAKIFPFNQQNNQTTTGKNEITITEINPNQSAAEYSVNLQDPEEKSYFIDVYGQIKNQKISLYFYHRYLPTINNQTFQEYLGSLDYFLPKTINDISNPSKFLANWPADSTTEVFEGLRLKLNSVVVPIPKTIWANKPEYITSFMLHEKTIKTNLLVKKSSELLDLGSFQQTNPASCYGPQLKGYVGSGKVTNDNLNLVALKGSYCVQKTSPETSVTNELNYVELEFRASGIGNENNPVSAYVCFTQGSTNCMNLHRYVRIFDQPNLYRLSVENLVSSQMPSTFTIGSNPVGTAQQTVIIDQINKITYDLSEEKNFVLNITKIVPTKVNLTGPVKISFPKAVSNHSYFRKPQVDLFALPIDLCARTGINERKFSYLGDILLSDINNCSVYFAQNFNYLTQSPYIFAFKYWLGSGQQPLFVLGHNREDLLTERVSLYQGYPNLLNMKPLTIDAKNIILSDASRLIEPQKINDSYSKEMTMHIFQDTENRGVLAVGGFDIFEYPNQWYGLSLVPKNYSSEYSAPEAISFKKILPSLWKIDFVANGNVMLVFNEGYDSQWRLFQGFKQHKPIKCNGFANCFLLNSQPGRQTNYIFYFPELLMLFGWIITILGIIFGKKILDFGHGKS